ncbi:hypothetical protein AFUB_085439 [Aspergillus fumigatus A1163]|uniref:Uncharacterized protein n=1 Tax=Aspergillus fumigatus (strain CBS 144.89 / FGSC A1163 / CEA10) TaxID=451804 RepID=B0YAQ1_ASPFC|nr:hypothetical protein AFUB_085439 [Aspergillus fumigatus A1163]
MQHNSLQSTGRLGGLYIDLCGVEGRQGKRVMFSNRFCSPNFPRSRGLWTWTRTS